MNQAVKNCIIVLINLEFFFINSFDLNDYFQSGKNQKILSDRNRFFKFDLVQFPIDNKPTPTPTITKTGFKNSIVKKKIINSNFQRKTPQTSEYVWDEIGKYWTYRSRHQSYPDFNFNGYANSPCKPPFCLPRRCDQTDCGQSNCATNFRPCARNNADCSMEQKRVSFGSEVVCINKKSVDNCVPDCGENGICIKSKCYCETGWFGDRCVILEPELCKQRKLLFCVHGCSFDKRKLDFNCICGIKETQVNCLELRVCSKGCQNGGTCVQGKCQCLEGFEGDECQLEINSCSLGQMGNRTCEHVCVSEGKHNFQCKCRLGYQLSSDGRSCVKKECSKIGTDEVVISGKCKCKQGWKGEFCNEDVDECLFPVCQQICVNTIGAYQCSCREGFTLLSNGKCAVSCLNYCNKNGDCLNGACYCFSGWHGEDCSIDIDECKYNHGCEHLCANVPGSYNCQCHPGFTLQADKKTCISKSCRNECQNGGWCDKNQCKCLQGFFGDSCEHTDFCHFFSPCEHNCTTSNGNMVCTCLPGYTLMPDERTCKKLECPKCVRGNCHENKCICPNGFAGLLCEKDINECLNRTICQHDCINTIGSFYCRCRNGHRLDVDKRSCVPQHKETCSDINCIHGQCFNSKCICKSGYKGKRCDEDINECKRYSQICEHFCTNNEGSYKCSCRQGFILSDNNHSCQLVCSLCQNGKCDFNNKCKCKTGWTGELCDVDVDECLLNQHKCQHNCINSNGSYSCSCNLPFYLSTLDGRSCIKKEEGCTSPCRNGGKCVNLKCKCKPGYKGDSCEEDINECQWPPSKHGCIGECRNTFGNYECICPPGYLVLNDQKTCQISTKDTMCNPHCLNGGVCRDMSRCYCPTGFQGLDCGTDVDECQRYAPCDKHHGICQNTYGSFYCQCSSNYVLMYDGTSCMTMKEAILNPHLRYRGRGTKGVTRIIEN